MSMDSLHDLFVNELKDIHSAERQITKALHRHASIEASNVHVSVESGRVTLEGAIPTYAERELVEEAVSTTAGVTEIENRLRVG